MLLRSCKSIIARRDSTYCRVNCNAIGSRRAGVQFVTNINPKSCRIPSSLLRQFGFCSQVKISRDISRILNYSNSKPSPQCLESSHCRLYHAVTIPVHAYVKSGSAPSLAYSKSRFRPLHDLAKAQTAWGLRSFQISKHSSSKVLLRCITSSAQDFGHLPMDANLQSLISSIHKAPEKAVVYVTGGGLQAVTWLLTVPGASNTVLEACIPYGQFSLEEILGHLPKEYASTDTVLELAQCAYKQAAHFSSFGTPIFGLSCSCALATDRQKKGDHKIFVATHNGVESRLYSIKLEKGIRDRLQEDNIASLLVIKALLQVSSLENRHEEQGNSLDLGLRSTKSTESNLEILEEETRSIGDPLKAFYDGRIDTVEFCGNKIVCNAPRRNRIYLPGSYNPLHEGHRKMMEAAYANSGRSKEGCYELSIGNPDKGTMPIEECKKRIHQFSDAGLPLLVTKAPLYSDKAKLCPGSTFVIGYDTAIRLIMPKYYGGYNEMLLDVHGIHHLGCKFLVVGRVEDERKFLTLEDIDLPREIAGLVSTFTQQCSCLDSHQEILGKRNLGHSIDDKACVRSWRPM